MSRRGRLPEIDQYFLFNLPFEARGCGTPAGVAGSRRDSAGARLAVCLHRKCSISRDPGQGIPWHKQNTVSSFPREASRVLRKVRTLNITLISAETATTGIGNRTAGTRGARSRRHANARLVDAASELRQTMIQQNEGNLEHETLLAYYLLLTVRLGGNKLSDTRPKMDQVPEMEF